MRFASGRQRIYRNRIIWTVFAVCGFLCLLACSEKPVVGKEPTHKTKAALRVTGSYFNRPVPGSSVAAAYMTLQNEGREALTLATFFSGAVERVELHNHEMSEGLMQMRRVDQLTVAAGESIRFEPGGYHLMLFGVNDSLSTVDGIDLVLGLADGQSITVRAQVKELL